MNKLLGLCLLFFGIVGCSSSQYPSNEMYYKEGGYAQKSSRSEQQADSRSEYDWSWEEEGVPKLHHKEYGRMFLKGEDPDELIEQYRIRGEKHMILLPDTKEVIINAGTFKYVGRLRDGEFGGRGVLTHYARDYVYEGYFDAGEMNGVGMATLSNGTIKAGIWKNNNLVEEYPVAKVRELLRGDDERMSFAEIELPEGATYVGGTKDGVPHGQGTITFPDGTRTILESRNGQPHGEATVIAPDGRRLRQIWEDGQLLKQSLLDKY